MNPANLILPENFGNLSNRLLVLLVSTIPSTVIHTQYVEYFPSTTTVQDKRNE